MIFSGALCIHEQINLIKSVWSEYPDYPASTNLTLQYGNLKNFFHAYSQNLYLKKSKSINNVTNGYLEFFMIKIYSLIRRNNRRMGRRGYWNFSYKFVKEIKMDFIRS